MPILLTKNSKITLNYINSRSRYSWYLKVKIVKANCNVNYLTIALDKKCYAFASEIALDIPNKSWFRMSNDSQSIQVPTRDNQWPDFRIQTKCFSFWTRHRLSKVNWVSYCLMKWTGHCDDTTNACSLTISFNNAGRAINCALQEPKPETVARHLNSTESQSENALCRNALAS